MVAVGSIMDGRGSVAALALETPGVLIGTRFLVAKESGIFPAYQDKMFSSRGIYCHYTLIHGTFYTFNLQFLY